MNDSWIEKVGVDNKLVKDVLLDLQYAFIVGREYSNLICHQLINWIKDEHHVQTIQTIVLNVKVSSVLAVFFILASTLALFYCLFSRKDNRQDHQGPPVIKLKKGTTPKLAVEASVFKTPQYTQYPNSWSIFDLAKTAYELGHAVTVIDIIDRLHYDVNMAIPSNGLTLFLCACLSGEGTLIRYMLKKGADVTKTTKAGDTALYLATFGVLNSAKPDVAMISELIRAGCSVNASNLAGYTPLHRAASHGNIAVIKTLLRYGADRYQASASGIYPIDSATNAGNLEAAKLLEINMSNPHVWDMIDPHTPPHISLGLQSPQRKHLIESTRRITSPYIMSPRVNMTPRVKVI